MPKLERCENCGRLIGRLERAHSWNEHVVCGACKVILQSQPALPDVKPEPLQPTAPPSLRGSLLTETDAEAPSVQSELPAPNFGACAACGTVCPGDQLADDRGVPLCPACVAAGPEAITDDVPVDNAVPADAG